MGINYYFEIHNEDSKRILNDLKKCKYISKESFEKIYKINTVKLPPLGGRYKVVWQIFN